MNKIKIVTLSFLVCSYLYANNEVDTKTNIKEKEFIEKYIKKDSKTYKSGIQQKYMNMNFNTSDIKNNIKNINPNSVKMPENENLEKSMNIAKEINSNVRSKKFQDKVTEYEKYILEDKKLNFKDKMGKYAFVTDKLKNSKYANVNYENKFLDYDSRLIICISSSVPKETIKTYFKDFEKLGTDVLFVMNGFVGNNPKYIQPTLKYIKDLLKYGNGDKDLYNIRVDINPKIFRKYSIKRVPATIFVKNYNPYSEIQGNSASGDNHLDEETAYISYGDSNIRYILEKINKKAKNKGLKKLIKKINGGFFNEEK
jgi:type-F conjugative transfer system pilin assembly protein TrbC